MQHLEFIESNTCHYKAQPMELGTLHDGTRSALLRNKQDIEKILLLHQPFLLGKKCV